MSFRGNVDANRAHSGLVGVYKLNFLKFSEGEGFAKFIHDVVLCAFVYWLRQ